MKRGKAMSVRFLFRSRRRFAAVAALVLTAPAAALAMPAVGDVLGTTPAAVTAALEAAGCPVAKFEAEHGKVEAKCTETATGKRWEIYIDPATGAVTRLKQDD
jgi:hypothetical protein